MTTLYPRPPIITRVNGRYQTVVPLAVQQRFSIRAGDDIAWVTCGDKIEIIPLPQGRWHDFRGAGRDFDFLADLIACRRQERDRDRLS